MKCPAMFSNDEKGQLHNINKNNNDADISSHIDYWCTEQQ